MADKVNDATNLSKTFTREWDNGQGCILRIHQLEIGDVGCVVWDAALVLAAFLTTQHYKLLIRERVSEDRANSDIKILELGAGTGIVGIQAAVIDKRHNVILTDLPDLVPLMQKNLLENLSKCKGSIRAETLCWGDDVTDRERMDVILMADCIYYEESLKHLINTLIDLSDETTLILCCYESRTEGKNPQTESLFFQSVQEHFHVEEIPTCKHHVDYSSPDIHIVKFTKQTITETGKNRLS